MADFFISHSDQIFNIFYAIFLFIIGSSIGSFLNVLIDRMPLSQSITGRSKCDYCKKSLKFVDLLPIISFFLLKGRCRYCHKKLSPQYPLVEILTGTMFVITWFFIPAKTDIIKGFSLALISCLIAIFFIDLKNQIIPDELQLTFFILSLIIAALSSHLSIDFIFKKVLDGLWVMLPILALHLVTRGRGMGFGDVKYSFIMGFFLRLYGGLIALYLAFVIGAGTGLILLGMRKTKLKSRIAFGPFLILGTLIVMFFPGIVYFQFFYLLNGWRLG